MRDLCPDSAEAGRVVPSPREACKRTPALIAESNDAPEIVIEEPFCRRGAATFWEGQRAEKWLNTLLGMHATSCFGMVSRETCTAVARDGNPRPGKDGECFT